MIRWAILLLISFGILSKPSLGCMKIRVIILYRSSFWFRINWVTSTRRGWPDLPQNYNKMMMKANIRLRHRNIQTDWQKTTATNNLINYASLCQKMRLLTCYRERKAMNKSNIWDFKICFCLTLFGKEYKLRKKNYKSKRKKWRNAPSDPASPPGNPSTQATLRTGAAPILRAGKEAMS